MFCLQDVLFSGLCRFVSLDVALIFVAHMCTHHHIFTRSSHVVSHNKEERTSCARSREKEDTIGKTC